MRATGIEEDDEWNRRARNETETERLDRNWAHLLQELRVVQTGVQVLTGFLLTLPFQDRFYDLTDLMQCVYLATIVCSVGSTIFLVAPVGMHRFLFRQHRIADLVVSAHRSTIAGLVLLGLALTGAVALIFDIVVGEIAALLAAIAMALAFGLVWIVIPYLRRTR